MGRLDGKVAVITGRRAASDCAPPRFSWRKAPGRHRRAPRAGGGGAGEKTRRQLHLSPDRRHGRGADPRADRTVGREIRAHRLPVQQCRRPGANRRHRGPRGSPASTRRWYFGGSVMLGSDTPLPICGSRARQHDEQWQHRRTARRLFHVAGYDAPRSPSSTSPIAWRWTRRNRHPRQLDLAGRDRHGHFGKALACRWRRRRRRLS